MTGTAGTTEITGTIAIDRSTAPGPRDARARREQDGWRIPSRRTRWHGQKWQGSLVLLVVGPVFS